jgi:hypothetical protein
LGHQVGDQEALGDSRDPGSAQNTRYAEAPELQLLHRWLDTWAGIGLVAVGLHRQGWELQLTQYGDGNWHDLIHHPGRPKCQHRSSLDSLVQGPAFRCRFSEEMLSCPCDVLALFETCWLSSRGRKTACTTATSAKPRRSITDLKSPNHEDAPSPLLSAARTPPHRVTLCLTVA